MPLLRNGTVVDDPWQGSDAGFVIDLATWQEERNALLARNVPLALTLDPADPVDSLATDVHRFAMIALDFPVFTDGRPYSTARLLRERFGYRGELRATGNVQRDQMDFMRRCGFDAFQVATEDAAKDYAAATSEISVTYQPVGA